MMTSQAAMAAFYRDLLEAEDAPSWGIFVNILIGDGVLLQFASPPTPTPSPPTPTPSPPAPSPPTPSPPIDFPPQHYAYLVDDEHFERAYAKIAERGLAHWADPQRTRPGEINNEHGGRGVYLLDPSGHYLELITRPYL